MGEPRSLLITLTGHDRPGVTSALFDAVRGLDAEVSDIEQVVIRGRLVLGMVIAVGASEPALRKAIEATAASLGLLAEISDDSAAGPAPGVSGLAGDHTDKVVEPGVAPHLGDQLLAIGKR